MHRSGHKHALNKSISDSPSLRQLFRQLIYQAFQVVSDKGYAEMYASDPYQEKNLVGLRSWF
jgi:hypothetical protein